MHLQPLHIASIFLFNVLSYWRVKFRSISGPVSIDIIDILHDTAMFLIANGPFSNYSQGYRVHCLPM